MGAHEGQETGGYWKASQSSSNVPHNLGAVGGLSVDGEEAPAPEDVSKWTVDDVCNFVGGLSGCGEYTRVFREQGIDGETLPLLTEEHLLSTMGLKLGPALKIRAQVSCVRGSEVRISRPQLGRKLWVGVRQPPPGPLSAGGQAPGPSLLHGQLPCGSATAATNPAGPGARTRHRRAALVPEDGHVPLWRGPHPCWSSFTQAGEWDFGSASRGP